MVLLDDNPHGAPPPAPASTARFGPPTARCACAAAYCPAPAGPVRVRPARARGAIVPLARATDPATRSDLLPYAAHHVYGIFAIKVQSNYLDRRPRPGNQLLKYVLAASRWRIVHLNPIVPHLSCSENRRRRHLFLRGYAARAALRNRRYPQRGLWGLIRCSRCRRCPVGGRGVPSVLSRESANPRIRETPRTPFSVRWNPIQGVGGNEGNESARNP